MEQYRDARGFVPLEPALEEVLIDLCERAEGNPPWFQIRGYATSCDELKALGYLEYVARYMDGTTAGAISEKGVRYPTDRSEYQRRYDEWTAQRAEEKALADKRRNEERKEDKRHDWKVNVVNGVYALVSAILGAVIGFLIGRI